MNASNFQAVISGDEKLPDHEFGPSLVHEARGRSTEEDVVVVVVVSR